MAYYLATDTELTETANALRLKLGNNNSIEWEADYGYANIINELNSGFAAIGVDYPEGSICTCTNGTITLTARDTSGKMIFGIPNVGSWTVSCTDGIDTSSKIVTINNFGDVVTITLLYIYPTLNDNSWTTISKIAQTGNGDTYWDIGDMKEIVLNGNIGDYLTLNNYITNVFILDFNYPLNKIIPDNNIIFGGFKTIDISTAIVDVCLCDSQFGVQRGSSASV